MMTMIGRLCALCAVCTLCEIVLPEGTGQNGLRMIGGLLMLHLVLTMAQELCIQLAHEKELKHIFEILMK